MHFLPAEQRFDLVIRYVFPLGLAKGDPLLPGEPDPPRRPGVKRQSIPRRLAAEASLWRALLHVVFEKDRRRQFLEAVGEVALDMTGDADG